MMLHPLLRLTVSVPFAFAVCSSALAQGGDECFNATVVVGDGPHAFDQIGASPSLETFGCNGAGNDVWFRWTASQSTLHRFSLCGTTNVDTVIGLYDGCGGMELECDEDGCTGTSQSVVRFQAVAGQTYLLRIGTYNGVAGGVGTFEVAPDLPKINPGNGHAYQVVPMSLDWPSAKLAAESMLWNGRNGHLVTITSAGEANWVNNNLFFSRPWIGLFQNTNSPTYSEPAGGWEWVTGEPYAYTNWLAGEPNDYPPVGGNENFVEIFPNGEWNDLLVDSFFVQSFIVEWDQGIAGTFCDPMDANSTGQSTNLAGSLTGPGGTSGLHLEMSQGPPNQLGYVLVGTGINEPGIPLSLGRFCLSVGGVGEFGRYNVPLSPMNSVGQFDTNGIFQNGVGTSTVGTGFDVPSLIPTIGGHIGSGETWHFQMWHRDAAVSSNFSNGLSVAF